MLDVAGMLTEFMKVAVNELWWMFVSELLNFGSARCILRCIHLCRTPDFRPTERA